MFSYIYLKAEGRKKVILSSILIKEEFYDLTWLDYLNHMSIYYSLWLLFNTHYGLFNIHCV